MTGPPPGASFFLFKEVPVAGKYALSSTPFTDIYPSVNQKLHSENALAYHRNESSLCFVFR